ncbi:hypothetical protein Pfo_021794, partial [Paulownia fortunei]
CHLLLGHHWQFNRSTFHDGRTNTYSFLFRGKKIVFLPSPDKSSLSLGESNTLLSYACFEYAIEELGIIYLLLGKTIFLSSDVPLEIQPFLSEFANIFLDE